MRPGARRVKPGPGRWTTTSKSGGVGRGGHACGPGSVACVLLLMPELVPVPAPVPPLPACALPLAPPLAVPLVLPAATIAALPPQAAATASEAKKMFLMAPHQDPPAPRRCRGTPPRLYRTVEAYWPEFRERAQEQGGLPKFVVKEFEEYLRCGRLEHGCLRLACCRCGFERLVALFTPHVASYVRLLLDGVVKPAALSDEAIANARTALRRPLERRFYYANCVELPALEHVVSDDLDADDAPRYPDVTLATLFGDRRDLLSVLQNTSPATSEKGKARTSIPAQYTRAVRARMSACLGERRLVIESWVVPLTPEERSSWEALPRLIAGVEDQYSAEYVPAWREFLTGSTMGVPGDAKGRLGLLASLTTGESPVARLIHAVEEHLADTPTSPALPRLTDWARPLIAATKPGALLEKWNALIVKLQGDIQLSLAKGGNTATLLRVANDDLEKLLTR